MLASINDSLTVFKLQVWDYRNLDFLPALEVFQNLSTPTSQEAHFCLSRILWD